VTQPKLTIAIPTYNRASKLEKQLAWAVNAIDGRWDEVELIVSDNASPDETPAVCDRWKALSHGALRIQRQQSNIGLVRNVLACIEAARGEFVWVVGDDDTIFPEAFPWVLDCIQREPSARLGYLFLNFRSTNGYDGSPIRERILPFEDDKLAVPGTALFEECAEIDDAGMLLISANIYSTQLARDAIERWPAITTNLAFPLFLSGYAAMHAGMLVLASPALECPYHTASHLGRWLNTLYLDIPAVYLALYREGYSSRFIRPRILSRVSYVVYALRFPVQFLKSLRIYLHAAMLRRD